ncbi:MAG TPA: plastocyanin/azurin family copper-binding protein [Gaiellaceae bacterium]|nr:plastocyanin/azurin family copper-binding protein [Gaiellaceae bacterium]
MTRRILLVLLAVAALGLAVAACGGDDDDEAEEPAAADTTTEDTTTEDGGGGEGTTLELAADPGGALAFDKTTLEAPAGEVTIHLVNEAQIPHNVEVDGNDVEEVSETITGGETDLTLTLEAGEYEFYCAVPGHREGGMEGTLTVE